MAELSKERITQLIRELDMACGGGRGPLSADTLAEVCAIATPFKKWSHRWVSVEQADDVLEIYNMDTGPDANPASGARFWPRADHDTDAAIELLAKIVPQPYRLDLTILEGPESPLLNKSPMARLQKTIDGTFFDLACQAEALPLAIVGLALKAEAVAMTARAKAQRAVEEELPPADDPPPPDSDDPLPSFEDLPA